MKQVLDSLKNKFDTDRKNMIRTLLISEGFGFCFSLSCIFGFCLDHGDTVCRSAAALAIELILAVLFAQPVCALLMYFTEAAAGKQIRAYEPKNPGLIWAISSAGLVLFWLPVYLAYFPSVFSYDAEAQLAQVISGSYSTHHPLLHTLLMGWCMKLMYHHGGINAGMALYSGLQLLIMAVICGWAMAELLRVSGSRVRTVIYGVFLACFPVNGILAVSTTKDVIFSGIMLVLVLLLRRFFCEGPDAQAAAPGSDKGNGAGRINSGIYIKTGAAALLLLLFRNNAQYALLLLMLYIFFFAKNSDTAAADHGTEAGAADHGSEAGAADHGIEAGAADHGTEAGAADHGIAGGTTGRCAEKPPHRRPWRLIITLGAALVLSWIIGAGMKTVLGADSGSPREMLSIPIQQMARAASLHGDELDEGLKNDLYSIMDTGTVSKYDEHLADPVKERISMKQPALFVKTWIKLGMKYPGTYFDAWLLTTEGAWYVRDISCNRIYGEGSATGFGYLSTDIRNMPEGFQVTDESVLPGLRAGYEKLVSDDCFEKVPVVRLLFAPALYFWILMAYVYVCAVKRKCRSAVPAVLLVCNFLTILCGPAVLVRYMYPYMLAIVLPLCGTSDEKR